jgi:hypothetical protein
MQQSQSPVQQALRACCILAAIIIAGAGAAYAAWPVQLESGSGVGDYPDIEGTIDGIIASASSVSGRVAQVETDVGTVSGRVTQVEIDVGTVSGRVTQVEIDVGTVSGRVTQVESDVLPQTTTNTDSTASTPRWAGDELVVLASPVVVYRASGTGTNDWLQTYSSAGITTNVATSYVNEDRWFLYFSFGALTNAVFVDVP